MQAIGDHITGRQQYLSIANLCFLIVGAGGTSLPYLNGMEMGQARFPQSIEDPTSHFFAGGVGQTCGVV